LIKTAVDALTGKAGAAPPETFPRITPKIDSVETKPMSSPRLKDRAKDKNPWIIAHRGYRARYPENTLIAFEAAVDVEVDMIELDVMLSKDRKMVVIHDADLGRTTNGRGTVGSHTLEEIKQLDAGSWFDARFARERLPTLEEVLELVNGRIALNIEIKRSAYEPHHPPDAVERQVVDLVRRKGGMDSVLVSSFEWRALENMVKMVDRPAIALLSRYPDEDHHLETCRKLGAFSWHPSYLAVKEEHVREMHDAGMLVFPYNADTPEDIQHMLNMGVDGVITSDPLLMKELIKPV
jgi:glycerophosphoryl diester phosphodiesterase